MNVLDYNGITTWTCTTDELLYYENGLPDTYGYALLYIPDPNQDGDLSDCYTDTSLDLGVAYPYVQVTHALPVQSDSGISAIFGTVTGADGLPYLTVKASHGFGPACTAVYRKDQGWVGQAYNEYVNPATHAPIATDGSPTTLSCTS